MYVETLISSPHTTCMDDYCKIDVTNIQLLMRVYGNISRRVFSWMKIGENYVLLDF